MLGFYPTMLKNVPIGLCFQYEAKSPSIIFKVTLKNIDGRMFKTQIRTNPTYLPEQNMHRSFTQSIRKCSSVV